METLRQALVEKETAISKLRIEIRESADKMTKISSFVQYTHIFFNVHFQILKILVE